MSKPDIDVARISYEEAIERFCKLEFGDQWVERITDAQMDLIQWYLVEKRRCTEALTKRAERAFLLREKMGQQRIDADRWLRTHVHIEWADVTVATVWNDVRSVHHTKVTREGTVSLAELEQALQNRFGKPDDARSRTEVLADYLRRVKEAGGDPTQTDAMKEITAAGHTWSRDDFRPAYKKMATGLGFAVGRGLWKRRP
jgi:hypothetical protein